jgi:hypothetical protein
MPARFGMFPIVEASGPARRSPCRLTSSWAGKGLANAIFEAKMARKVEYLMVRMQFYWKKKVKGILYRLY